MRRMSKVHAPEKPEGQGEAKAEAPAAEQASVAPQALVDAARAYREAAVECLAAQEARAEMYKRHEDEETAAVQRYRSAQMVLNACLADLEHEALRK